MGIESGERAAVPSRRLVPGLAVGPLVVGALVLTGWLFDVEELRQLTPLDEQPRVKVNTAICIIATAVAVLLLRVSPVSRPRRRVARALGGLVTSIGLATLAQYAFGFDLGIDQLLIEEQVGEAARTPHPGRMAANSALAFLLIGSAVMAFDLRWRRRRPANLLAALTAGLAILALDGLLLGVYDVPLFSQYANMALPTAAALLALGVAVVAARPDAGAMRLLAGDGPSGVAARRLIPAVVVIPVLVGWLRLLGQHHGLFNLEFGTWITAAGMTAIFGSLVWVLLRRLERAEEQAREHRALLVAAREQAERAGTAKSEFISRMSHELRTPLNSILGFSQLLQLDGLRPNQTEHVDHVIRGGRRLLALINEVLDIATIDAGRLSISPEPVAVGDLIEETLASLAPAGDAKGVQLAFVPTPSDLYARADRQRLQQILLNLVSNAIKYGGGSVSVGAEQRHGRVILDVLDDGGGQLSATQMAAMFEAFERLGAGGGSEQGTGLGLSLSRQLAELMDGSISVTSTADRGTTFTVDLPQAAGPPAQPAVVLDGPADVRAQSTHAFEIVYIEDNAANIALVERLVTRHGGSLSAATGGLDGIALAQERRPDLILLDLHLPDMSGLDVLRELRARPGTCTIPIVMLTADATPGTRRQAEAMTADGYLTKPLDVDRFLETIDELMVHV